MIDPYRRNREFFGSVSGNYHILATDTGLVALVAARDRHTTFLQKLHIEVTLAAGAELWTFQDGVPVALVPVVAAGAIAHFDFDFGPDGVPCTEGTGFNLNITGATGAIGWASWEAFQKLTLGAAPAVGGAPIPAVSRFKLVSGPLMAVPELGAVEFFDDGTTGHLYITLHVAGVLTRVQIV